MLLEMCTSGSGNLTTKATSILQIAIFGFYVLAQAHLGIASPISTVPTSVS